MDAAPRKPYRTDLTDDQWGLLATVLPPAKSGGRPRAADLREVVNAMLYLSRSGCQWDLLPHDLPPKSTVYDYFAAWRADGWTAQFDHSPTYTKGAPDNTAANWSFVNASYPMAAYPDQLWIDGVAQPMRSRQIELRDRYLTPHEGALPKAYER